MNEWAGRPLPISTTARHDGELDVRLGHLEAPAPEVSLSANIGCIARLQGGTQRPVKRWIEWLDERPPSPPRDEGWRRRCSRL